MTRYFSSLALAAGLTAAALSPALAVDPALRSMGFGTPTPTTKGHAASVSTAFELMPDSLQDLLNRNYVIHSSAGEEGNILILQKDNGSTRPYTWVRCELMGDRNGDVRLTYSQHVSSLCWKLN
ncbi:ABC transporter substrate-binding protein [Gluconobacter sp. Dm-44]|uniref:ABC transporter substrate-binding protein n=1 Tax=Gluconobacter sp. Dm-44 TaxID=2799805 RepID=UPI001B8A8F5A|nr:ABC transporter substrate-binding protein [Gluconobacter sp. Dm-44]